MLGFNNILWLFLFMENLQEIHELLIHGDQSEKYLSYLTTVHDRDAVTGSLALDNGEAARMIREKAAQLGNHLQNEKLAVIAKALGLVLRARYHSGD
jgi:hypothetical protein